MAERNKYVLNLTKYSHDEQYEKQLTVKYNGIDRVNNNEGYTLLNSLSCCIICNRAKNSLSYGEFIEWVKCLASYRCSLF